jgi:hypothetical protein
LSGRACGRLGAWWPPGGEHCCALDVESSKQIVPLPVGRENVIAAGMSCAPRPVSALFD